MRGVIAVLGAALVVSLGANVALVRANNGYYRQVSDVRLDPPGLEVYASKRAEPPPSDRPVLAIFGDSRALMWSAPTTVLPEYAIVDVGVGNQTTAQLLLRFDADVPRLHPSVIVLEGGVNDLKTISEFPERRAKIVADCKANLVKLVAKSRETGATVVLTTIFAIGDIPLWRKPFWSNDVDDVVREVNAFVRTLKGDKVVVFDADPILDREDGKIQKPYQFDFLHVSPAGYDALNERLAPLVKALPR
jgi:lysophospholipase L1-like esterase